MFQKLDGSAGTPVKIELKGCLVDLRVVLVFVLICMRCASSWICWEALSEAMCSDSSYWYRSVFSQFAYTWSVVADWQLCM